ncbi:DUF6510 family protein [Streptomyces sp. NPDC059597]|uniref:DUF6510 family protein n=1 Tax=Streptomyces sp. NPDC059597 TaxID=3346879 RepID=UPI0036B39254
MSPRRAEPESPERHRLDGNALAGPLSELFAVDVTVATCRCEHCGAEGSVSTLQLYNRAPGLVARCPYCEGVVLRFVRTDDAAYLDLRGAVMLQVPLPVTD